MTSLKLEPGRLICVLPDGETVFLGDCTEITVADATECSEFDYIPVSRNTRIEAEAETTAICKMTKEMWLNFYDVVLGLASAIYEMCPDKKVVHLAQYGRTPRVRKKNRARVVRLLEKQAERERLHQ